MNNIFQFSVWGRQALFTDPVTKTGGEKFSYPVPTYEALKGIAESIYWKPTFSWRILRVRVMKRIRREDKSMRPLNWKGGTTLSKYTVLTDVEYQVEAALEWNLNRKELEDDRNLPKHMAIASKALKKGGRRDIFLGTRECQAYVEPCVFGEGEGFYDGYGKDVLGVMFHSFVYPDEENGRYERRLWNAVMDNGIIEFPAPDDASLVSGLVALYRPVMKRFKPDVNCQTADNEEKEF